MTKTTWVVTLGDKTVYEDAHDPDTAVYMAWSHAMGKWCESARYLGLDIIVNVGQWGNAADARVEGFGAHVNLYATGKCAFGGKKKGRVDLSALLLRSGLLRGAHGAITGGTWDLPAKEG